MGCAHPASKQSGIDMYCAVLWQRVP